MIIFPVLSFNHRRGYSLTVVLLFLLLLFFLWAAVYRTTASFLRVETVRVKRNDLDEGLQAALAKALWYLETNPALPRQPVTYGITVSVSPNNPQGSNFIASFTPSASPSGWTIRLIPGTCSTPLPGS